MRHIQYFFLRLIYPLHSCLCPPVKSLSNLYCYVCLPRVDQKQWPASHPWKLPGPIIIVTLVAEKGHFSFQISKGWECTALCPCPTLFLFQHNFSCCILHSSCSVFQHSHLIQFSLQQYLTGRNVWKVLCLESWVRYILCLMCLATVQYIHLQSGQWMYLCNQNANWLSQG